MSAMMNQITDTKEATSNRASNGRGYELRGVGGVVSSANQAGQFNCSSLTCDYRFCLARRIHSTADSEKKKTADPPMPGTFCVCVCWGSGVADNSWDARARES